MKNAQRILSAPTATPPASKRQKPSSAARGVAQSNKVASVSPTAVLGRKLSARTKRVILSRGVRVLGVLLLLVPASMAASALATTSSPDVLITEVQTSALGSDGKAKASQEFIELYNNSDSDIDFADTANQGKHIWKLQFFDSSKVTPAGIDWNPKTTGLTTVSLIDAANPKTVPIKIAAHEYFLVSTAPSGQIYLPGGVEPDFTYSSGHMSDTGGGVQLVDVSGTGNSQVFTAHAQVGWSQATPLPTSLLSTPAAGGSLQRIVNEDRYLDDSGSLTPFIDTADSTPKAAWQPPEPAPSPPATGPPAGTTGGSSSNDDSSAPGSTNSDGADTPAPEPDPAPVTPVLPLQISELLPNPAAPATDANDEFVELFNPNTAPVDLNGYKLQTGSNYSYSFTFTTETIDAGAYEAFYAPVTGLLLANTAGKAHLINPTGQVIAETDAYENAGDGEAWALVSGQWQWTTTPTPDAPNVLTNPSVLSASSTAASSKSSTVKKAAAPKAATTKTIKAAAPKAVKTTKASTTKPVQAGSQDPTSVQIAPLHPAILAGVGGLALVYAAYEYRHDVANRLYQFRRYRASRRAYRQTT